MANVLNFGTSKRKEFVIDGDENRVIHLDTGDTGILARWYKIQEWYENADKRAQSIAETVAGMNEDEAVKHMSREFEAIENEMREKLNFLFDEDVCTPIAGNGSIMRSIDGEPLYSKILNTLFPLYEAEIKRANQRTVERVSKHTNKYRSAPVTANKTDNNAATEAAE